MSQLPSSWAEATVGEVGEVRLGRQRSPRYHTGPNMRPYLRVKNVFENRIDLSDVMEMDFSPADFERYRLEPGDILLNEGQSPELVGRPAMYRGELPGACFTNSLIRFRPHGGIDRQFSLYLFLHHLWSGRFRREARITTNIAHLSATRFSSVEFPVPPLKEQQRIVVAIEENLSRLDGADESLALGRRRLDGFRVAVFKDAFRRSWPRAKFQDVASVDSDLVDPGDFPHWPHIAPNHIESHTGRLLPYRSISEDGVTSPKHRFRPGQILYSKIRPYLAKAALVDFEGLCSADMYPISTSLDARFLLWWMLTPEFTELAVGQQGRSVLPKINQLQLARLPVPVPSSTEQHETVEWVEAQLLTLDQLRSSIDRARLRSGSVRRAVLERAFRGELVRQDSSDEPASVLLARIRATQAAAPGVIV